MCVCVCVCVCVCIAKRGDIINISSRAGKTGIPNVSTYCASKVYFYFLFFFLLGIPNMSRTALTVLFLCQFALESGHGTAVPH